MVAFRRQTVKVQRKATPESEVKYKDDQSVLVLDTKATRT